MAEKNLRSLKFPGSDDVYKIAQPDYAQTDSTQPDFIKNKIVGDVVEYSDTLTWDGKDTGLGNISIEDGFMVLYRVSENAVSLEDLKNGVEGESYGYDDDLNAIVDHWSISYEDLIIQNNVIFIEAGYIFIALNDNSVLDMDGIVINFEKAGIYFTEQLTSQITKSLTITGYSGFATKSVKKLDKKYFDVTWDNVKDKPFGIDWDNPTVIVENQTIEFMEDEGFCVLELPNVLLDVNSFYKLVLNGTEYILKPEYTVVDGTIIHSFGNLALIEFGEDTGENFISYSMPDINASVLFVSENEAVCVSLYEYKFYNKYESVLGVFLTTYKRGTDMYLYKSFDITTQIGEKVTRDELTMAMKKGVIMIDFFGAINNYPLFCNTGWTEDLPYGYVGIMDDNGKIITLYTAEYTP